MKKERGTRGYAGFLYFDAFFFMGIKNNRKFVLYSNTVMVIYNN